MELMRFDVCIGDRVPACASCARAVANVLQPGMGPIIPRFNPVVRETHCGDWKHVPRAAQSKPEETL